MKIKYTYHKDGTKPENGEIFVFGSNLAGYHGGGAALEAQINYGAEYGNGIGISGNSYAIPTKDHRIKTLSLIVIKAYISMFIQYAKENSKMKFFITRVGCGLAGLKDNVIAPYFLDAPENCNFPIEWKYFFENGEFPVIEYIPKSSQKYVDVSRLFGDLKEEEIKVEVKVKKTSKRTPNNVDIYDGKLPI